MRDKVGSRIVIAPWKKFLAALPAAVMMFVAVVPARGQAEFRPPFKFFDTCQSSTKVGEGSVNYWSRPTTGDMHLGVQTTWVGQVFGRTGAGVTYVPTFSGPVRIKAFVSVNAGSADAAYAAGPSVVALNSDVYVKLDGRSPATFRFRGASQNTLRYGLADVVKRLFPELSRPLSALTFLNSDAKSYTQSALYIAQLDTVATKNIPMRICGGVQSNTLSANLFPLLSGVSARYEARLLKLTVERR